MRKKMISDRQEVTNALYLARFQKELNGLKSQNIRTVQRVGYSGLLRPNGYGERPS